VIIMTLWEIRDGDWVFTPNPNYQITIRKHLAKQEYLVQICKLSNGVLVPMFLIGRYETINEIKERIAYVINNQYADLREIWMYEE